MSPKNRPRTSVKIQVFSVLTSDYIRGPVNLKLCDVWLLRDVWLTNYKRCLKFDFHSKYPLALACSWFHDEKISLWGRHKGVLLLLKNLLPIASVIRKRFCVRFTAGHLKFGGQLKRIFMHRTFPWFCVVKPRAILPYKRRVFPSLPMLLFIHNRSKQQK